jgi:hypothetical protein
VLVKEVNWLGDVVMSTPALRALHCRFPGAALTVAGRTITVAQPGGTRTTFTLACGLSAWVSSALIRIPLKRGCSFHSPAFLSARV